jgi:nicotinate-nucleotide adenylyltransferase
VLEKKEHIGLLLGSFNPIHIGHLIMAEMALEKCSLDGVWFIVSPMNPAKAKSGILIDENERLQMTKIAAEYNDKFYVSNIEFSMPRPSFTNNTLRHLREIRPNKKFSIICGTDTHFKIPFWRNAQEVVDNHDFILYERGGNDKGVCAEKGIDKKTTLLENVPVLEISSTFIREQIKNNGSLKHLLPEAVIEHIKRNNLYK